MIMQQKNNNATKRYDVMTFCDYEIDKKLQCESAGYVKVKLIACSLSDGLILQNSNNIKHHGTF